ncbi:hypothetical protein AB0A91_34260 [Streptomyces sp. NPDC042207]|uniref:hypothetical protein n=1 Tax=Streptomyces sp. NPDC042207 TaxID=3154331 RepID=UPI0033D1BD5D
MPPKQMTSVRIEPLGDQEDGRAHKAAVTVEPEDHADLAVTFNYVLLPGEVLGPFGLHVEPRSELRMGDGWKLEGDPQRFGVAILRDLPIARWERAARLAAQLHQNEQIPWGWEGGAGEDTVTARAEDAVRILHPGVDPASGKAGARKWAKLTRYAQVVLQCQQGQLAGDADPVGVVASQRGVSPATVRSWLYRARLEGITPESISEALAGKSS